MTEIKQPIVSWQRRMAVVMNLDSLDLAIQQYTQYTIGPRVDPERTIGGAYRPRLKHRVGMPREWWGYAMTLQGLIEENPDLLSALMSVLTAAFAQQPTIEAALCVAEDLNAIADWFAIRGPGQTYCDPEEMEFPW